MYFALELIFLVFKKVPFSLMLRIINSIFYQKMYVLYYMKVNKSILQKIFHNFCNFGFSDSEFPSISADSGKFTSLILS